MNLIKCSVSRVLRRRKYIPALSFWVEKPSWPLPPSSSWISPRTLPEASTKEDPRIALVLIPSANSKYKYSLAGLGYAFIELPSSARSGAESTISTRTVVSMLLVFQLASVIVYVTLLSPAFARVKSVLDSDRDLILQLSVLLSSISSHFSVALPAASSLIV